MSSKSLFKVVLFSLIIFALLFVVSYLLLRNNTSINTEIPSTFNKSNKNFHYNIQDSVKNGTFIDLRDGREYKTMRIGDKIWMAENLKFNIPGQSWLVDDNINNLEKYGLLYKWETALKVCPQGWRLPNNKEFEELFKKKLNATQINHDCFKLNSNISNFLYETGGGRGNFGNYMGIEIYGYWWTSSRKNQFEAWGVTKNMYKNDIGFYGYFIGSGFCVRCVKDINK